MTQVAKDSYGHIVQAMKPGTVQKVTISGTSAATSTAFVGTVIRVVSTTPCHFTVGTSPTATTSLSYLPAFVVEYLRVDPGDKIAFIQASAGGFATVTECAE